MMKRKFFFSFMIVVMMTSAGNSVSQNFIVENDDPFVRGLQRQKTFDGFQKRISNVTNKNNLKQREENTQRIFDFPNFNQILSFSHYRVDGLLVLEAPQSPVIHLDKSDLKNNKSTYPSILGIEESQKKAELLIEEALLILDKLPFNTEKLNALCKLVVNRKN